MDQRDASTDTARNAAALLSTTGALVLGVGVGALLGDAVGRVAWILAAVGLVAHLWGMTASRRLQRDRGYRFARWETAGYWLCWLLIVAGLLAAVWRLLAD